MDQLTMLRHLIRNETSHEGLLELRQSVIRSLWLVRIGPAIIIAFFCGSLYFFQFDGVIDLTNFSTFHLPFIILPVGALLGAIYGNWKYRELLHYITERQHVLQKSQLH